MDAVKEFDKALSQLKASLRDITSVEATIHPAAEVFTLIFCEAFASDQLEHQLENERLGATRSNWTYHTAFAIKRTAQIMGLSCRFEAMGRLDAVIETVEEKPRIAILAEWEWDYQDIFDKGKELEKLWKGTSGLKYGNALLFTYCPLNEYEDFVKSVIEYWQGRAVKKKNPPLLFLPVVVFKGDSFREFQFMRIVEIHPRKVKLWNDVYFSLLV